MLLNKARAYEIMDRCGLDGLVAVSPINVYYLSDFWGALMRMGRTFYNYAVLPRDENAPAAVVMTAVESQRLHYNPAATWMPNVCGYVHPIYRDRRDFDPDVEDPEAVIEGMAWPINFQGLSPDEKAYVGFIESQRGKYTVNALYALKRAILDAGLAGKVLGTDDPRIGPWLDQIGTPGVQVRDATSVFRDIRMVKTEQELDYLRTASRMNQEALDVVLCQLHAGQPRADLEIIYNTEIAKRGGRGIYLNTGQRGRANNLGKVVAGQSITFDALCHYRNYHGDLGRVAICGEPGPDLVKRMKAIEIGCEVAYSMIRPGVTGRAVTEAVLEAVRKAGFEGFFFATPHSIGLEHSDQPLPIGPELPGDQGEFVYLENMVFSIDMPYLEVGWGNLHVEDAVRVTATGVEFLTSGDVSLRVLPAQGVTRLGDNLPGLAEGGS